MATKKTIFSVAYSSVDIKPNQNIYKTYSTDPNESSQVSTGQVTPKLLTRGSVKKEIQINFSKAVVKPNGQMHLKHSTVSTSHIKRLRMLSQLQICKRFIYMSTEYPGAQQVLPKISIQRQQTQTRKVATISITAAIMEPARRRSVVLSQYTHKKKQSEDYQD